MNILKDCKFINGFNLTHTDALVTRNPVKHLNYIGTAPNPASWKIAQWGSVYNLANYNEYLTETGRYIYSDVSKKLSVKPGEASIDLELNCIDEYKRPRKEGETWPSILLEQSFDSTNKFNEMTEMSMNVDFCINKFIDHMGSTKTDLHTAQFQWFITVANTNKNSKGFNDFMWFGLCYFDCPRFDYPPGYSAQDGGKEENTAKFINIIPAKKYLENSVKIGQRYNVNVNVLNYIKESFVIAKERGFLVDCDYEDMAITSMNIGLEVTGIFDVAVNIKQLSIDFSLKNNL